MMSLYDFAGHGPSVLRSVLSASAAALLLAVAPTLTLAAETPADAKPVTLVAFGDSLTAGYMLPANDSFPAQLQMALQAKGYKVTVVNAGVSGDTTAGGLARLDWTMPADADAVILELGANDALRGVDPSLSREALTRIMDALAAKGLPVLLAGMKAPNNWGPDYAARFDAMYPELATKYGAALYSFFLDGVALNPTFVMADGLHPTAAGVAEIVKRILPQAEALVQRAASRKGATPAAKAANAP